MQRSNLGKRTRASAPIDIEHVELPPIKRSKRVTRNTSTNNDENAAPRSVVPEQKPLTPTEDADDDEDEARDKFESPSKPRNFTAQPTSIRSYPVTPSTPRHRDIFAGQPTTPRHIVMSAGKLFSRLTPKSGMSPGMTQTVYHSGRQMFARGADPGNLVGRDVEREQLKRFLARISSPTPSGCLYVSGPPGTGKSAMVQHTTKDVTAMENVRHMYINCMSIKSSKGLYTAVLETFSDDANATEGDGMIELQRMFLDKQSTTTYLLVLDEVDHVLTMGLESLYRLFEWSLAKPSRLMMIGIANALDLTDRHLPRLKAKNLKPELLPFLSYSAGQVKNIITTRLKKLLPNEGKDTDYVPLIHPAAIELCSRKISSQTGDLRKAFEICRRALDVIEAETRQKHEEEAREKVLLMTPSRKPLVENANVSNGGSQPRSISQTVVSSMQALKAENAPRASIGHLNKVTAAAFSNGTNQRLKALNLQQKAALCTLAACERRNRAAKSAATTPSKSQPIAPTIRMLYDMYAQLCTSDSVLHPLSSSEFREVVGSLETLGLVQEVDGRSGSLVMSLTPSRRGRKGALPSGDEKRIASCVGEKEMEQVTDGVGSGILKSILSGEALD